jgi:hypothetical protein
MSRTSKRVEKPRALAKNVYMLPDISPKPDTLGEKYAVMRGADGLIEVRADPRVFTQIDPECESRKRIHVLSRPRK